MSVLENGEVAAIAELLPLLLTGDRLDREQRDRLFRRLSSGPEALRRIALDWILRDRGIDLDVPANRTDSLVEALRSWGESRDLSVRRDALVVLTMLSRYRKDLIPVLVDALDDPATRDIAVERLDGREGRGPGPVLPPSANLDEKVAILKSWWVEKGSKEPAFQRLARPETSGGPSGRGPEGHLSQDFSGRTTGGTSCVG